MSLENALLDHMIVNQPPVEAPAEPVVETPVVETPVVNTETPVTPEATPEPGTAPVETPPVETPEPPSFISQLNTLFGEEFDSEDAAKTHLEGLQAPKDPEYPYEFVGEMMNYLQQSGLKDDAQLKGAMKEWMNLQLLDIGQMVKENPLEVMKMAYSRKYPTLTSEEIATKLEEDFPISAGQYEQDEETSQESIDEAIRRANIELKIAATDSSTDLKKLQSELRVPAAEKARIASQKNQEANNTATIEQYQKNASKVFDSFKELKVGEDYTHQVLIKGEDGKYHPTFQPAYDAMNNPHGFVQDLLMDPKTGFPDPAKVSKVAYVMANLDAISRARATKASGGAVEEIINQTRNANSPTNNSGNPNSGDANITSQEQLWMHMKGLS